MKTAPLTARDPIHSLATLSASHTGAPRTPPRTRAPYPHLLLAHILPTRSALRRLPFPARLGSTTMQLPTYSHFFGAQSLRPFLLIASRTALPLRHPSLPPPL